MKNAQLAIEALILISLFFGCASSPPAQRNSNGEYVLFRQDLRGIFGDPLSFRTSVVQEANKMAEDSGGTLIPLSFNQTAVRPGVFATIEYHFLILSPADLKLRDKSTRVNIGDLKNVYRQNVR